jgi:hypothetical protein
MHRLREPASTHGSAHTRRFKVFAYAILCCALFTGCSGSEGIESHLVLAGGGASQRIEDDIGGLRIDQPVSVGAITICLDRPGHVTLEGLKGINTRGGFHVDAFAIRPNPILTGQPGLGQAHGRLADLGFDLSMRRIRVVCTPDSARGYELGVQLSRSSAGVASSTGFRVFYVSNGESGTLDIRFAVALCPGDPSLSDCRVAD